MVCSRKVESCVKHFVPRLAANVTVEGKVPLGQAGCEYFWLLTAGDHTGQVTQARVGKEQSWSWHGEVTALRTRTQQCEPQEKLV